MQVGNNKEHAGHTVYNGFGHIKSLKEHRDHL